MEAERWNYRWKSDVGVNGNGVQDSLVENERVVFDPVASTILLQMRKQE